MLASAVLGGSKHSTKFLLLEGTALCIASFAIHAPFVVILWTFSDGPTTDTLAICTIYRPGPSKQVLSFPIVSFLSDVFQRWWDFGADAYVVRLRILSLPLVPVSKPVYIAEHQQAHPLNAEQTITNGTQPPLVSPNIN